MPNRFRAAAKTGIRRTLRRTGYEIVPLATGLVEAQRRMLSDADVAVDIGANVGQYGERLRDLGFTRRIVSFEPSADAFRILATKTQRDGNWDARQCALGAESGTATLNVSANSVSSSLLTVGDVHLRAAPESRIVETESVPVSTLDEQLADVPGRLFVKLDVQGYEQPVLSGAEATLQRTDTIQTEVSFDALYEGQTQWLELCGFLQDRGFVVRYVEPGYEDRDAGIMLQADFLFGRRPS